ncbi:hypothetical protein TNCV_3966251 [Trichonephila clavipes]|nr:hypothetical protein TNCV_3966251 [Trichonephila clavipes]
MLNDKVEEEEKSSFGFQTFHKQKENHCLLSFLEIVNGTNKLNGRLHPNDYEGRRVTHCIEALPTTYHSALDTSTVAKPWEKK